MIESPIVGSWRLISFELRDEAGTVSRPWGDDVSGITTFTPDGYLSEQFGSAQRPNLAHDDWVSATPTEIDLAARHYFAYAGSFELDGDAVIYRMKLAITPFASRQLINHGHVNVNGRRAGVRW